MLIGVDRCASHYAVVTPAVATSEAPPHKRLLLPRVERALTLSMQAAAIRTFEPVALATAELRVAVESR
jgi:hypothetical protein